jgi:hypothetical protein
VIVIHAWSNPRQRDKWFQVSRLRLLGFGGQAGVRFKKIEMKTRLRSVKLCRGKLRSGV